ENQCKGCHHLTFERRVPDDASSGHVQVPHRLQPKELREFLEAHYTARVLEKKFKLFDHAAPTRPLPGRLLLPEGELQKVRKQINQKVNLALRDLLLSRK